MKPVHSPVREGSPVSNGRGRRRLAAGIAERSGHGIQVILAIAMTMIFSMPLAAATPSEDFAHLAGLIEADAVNAGLEWIYGPEFVAGLTGQGQRDAMWKETRTTMLGYLEHREQMRFAEAKSFRFRNNVEGFSLVPVTIDGIEKLQMVGKVNGHWVPGKIRTREQFDKAIAKGEVVPME